MECYSQCSYIVVHTNYVYGSLQGLLRQNQVIFFILSLTLEQSEFYAKTPGYVSQNKLSMRSMNQLKVP